MEIESVNTKANAGLTTGIIGTALSGLLALHGGAGSLFGTSGTGNAAVTGLAAGLPGMILGMNNNNKPEFATKDDLNYAQELARKDSEIALLKSEQNTEVKIADVYERIMTRVNADQRAQADWNASQSVANAQMSAAIAANTTSIAALR